MYYRVESNRTWYTKVVDYIRIVPLQSKKGVEESYDEVHSRDIHYRYRLVLDLEEYGELLTTLTLCAKFENDELLFKFLDELVKKRDLKSLKPYI